MKKILLLGANGQLGTDVVKIFQNSPLSLTGLTRHEFDADYEDPFVKLAPFKNYDYLINCIAYHKTDQCEKNFEKSFKINGNLVWRLAKFCSRHNLIFVHISTDYVFDGYKKEPYNENDLPSPLNVYGASKLVGESLVKAYSDKYFVFRVSSLFGSKVSDDANINFVEKMVRAAKEGRTLKVIDDQIMSPTHTLDVARALRFMIENDISDYGIYHCCNGGECSWYEFANKIFDLTGLENKLTPISYREFHSTVKRPQYCSMDNSKLSKYYKMPLWTEALEEYLKIKGYIKG